MHNRLLKIFAFIAFSLFAFNSKATHNRAGEITFRQISNFTYEATLITYTHAQSLDADRPQIDLDWGDGTVQNVTRQSQTNIGNEILRNVYVATHTYSGPGTFVINFTDPNRIASIRNIPNSVDIPFYIETTLQIFAGGFGFNNSPVLLQPPIDFAAVGEVFKHNPNAYDSNGDSLSFTLIPPKRDVGTPVDGYSIPPTSNIFELNEYTGELIWDAPTQVGIYNIAILIEEYRNGTKIGDVTRDMQIIVKPGDNQPPIIDPVPDTCVVAGSQLDLNFRVVARDPDSTVVSLSARGGPFVLESSPATFTDPPPSREGTVRGEFSWEISCDHIRKEPYRVVFKATDSELEPVLADLEHFDIKVIGPEPQNVSAEPIPKGIDLDWDIPVCANAIGYRVYRRIDTSFWNPDYCETGIPGNLGFTMIKEIVGGNETEYLDETVSPGAVYCYRIVALYRNEGQYEFAESYASIEVCARLRRDIPIITKVDILSTSTDSGIIHVNWTKPFELDSITYDPPYFYRLQRATGQVGSNYETIYESSVRQSFYDLINLHQDTLFFDSTLNTDANAYSYNVQLFRLNDEGDEEIVGSSGRNTSLRLNINPTHEALNLSWDATVTWQNDSFVVWKEDTLSDTFVVLDTVGQSNYKDTGLVNGTTYCYFIESIGSFSAPRFPEPIINRSQIECGFPVDTIPPCPPDLTVNGICSTYTNELNWIYEFECDTEVVRYKVYFKNHRGEKFEEIANIEGLDSTFYSDMRSALRESAAGCYAVTAIDIYSNESRFSNVECVDNCPEYELPNIFTPNGDGLNDVFRPMTGWRFIDEVDFTVFNRWGEKVYETNDPQLNWNGNDMTTGKRVSAGTYYFDIIIYEKFLDKTDNSRLQGTITVTY